MFNKNSLKLRKIFTILFFIFLFEFIILPLPVRAMERNQGILVEKSGIDIQAQIAAIDENFELNLEKIQKFSDENRDKTREIEQFGPIKSKIKVKAPIIKQRRAEAVKIREITAYNSEASQCDATPCITANGFNLCKHGVEDTVAANFLPFGSKIKIPDLYGDKIFIVRDRMHPRYQNRVDIWMASRHDALDFGRRVAKIIIVD